MKVIGIDPGKTGAIFIYETEPDNNGDLWFPHVNEQKTFSWKPFRVIKIPLIVPPVILTRKLDKKGKRKKKQPKSTIDYDELARLFLAEVKDQRFTRTKVRAFIERVTGSISQGAQTGSFNFGTIYGFLRGLLAGQGIETTLVGPAVWKAAVGIVSAPTEKSKRSKTKAPKKGGKEPKAKIRATEDKHLSRTVATKFFPSAADNWGLAKEDGVAESALICQYGCQLLGCDL